MLKIYHLTRLTELSVQVLSYLLYWYKCTNSDAASACAAQQTHVASCNAWANDGPENAQYRAQPHAEIPAARAFKRVGARVHRYSVDLLCWYKSINILTLALVYWYLMVQKYKY